MVNIQGCPNNFFWLPCFVVDDFPLSQHPNRLKIVEDNPVFHLKLALSFNCPINSFLNGFKVIWINGGILYQKFPALGMPSISIVLAKSKNFPRSEIVFPEDNLGNLKSQSQASLIFLGKLI